MRKFFVFKQWLLALLVSMTSLAAQAGYVSVDSHSSAAYGGYVTSAFKPSYNSGEKVTFTVKPIPANLVGFRRIVKVNALTEAGYYPVACSQNGDTCVFTMPGYNAQVDVCYYPEKFVTNVFVKSYDSQSAAASEMSGLGYNLVDKNFDDGCSSSKYVAIGYKLGSNPDSAVVDLMAYPCTSADEMKSFTANGLSYVNRSVSLNANSSAKPMYLYLAKNVSGLRNNVVLSLDANAGSCVQLAKQVSGSQFEAAGKANLNLDGNCNKAVYLYMNKSPYNYVYMDFETAQYNYVERNSFNVAYKAGETVYFTTSSLAEVNSVAAYARNFSTNSVDTITVSKVAGTTNRYSFVMPNSMVQISVKAKVNLNNGKCLIFTSRKDGSQFSMDMSVVTGKQVYYSVNNSGWQTYISNQKITLNNGDKLRLSECEEYGIINFSKRFTFSITGDVAVSGHIMALYDRNADERTIPDGVSYENMFKNCVGLTEVDANLLPATVLTNSCYQGMFMGCTSLKKAPYLRADTLKYRCYANMFNGCTSLTSMPQLPSTYLESACYMGMFSGCTNLKYVENLPALQTDAYCYKSMFKGCTSLTTAPKISAVDAKGHSFEMMFENCTLLENLPELKFTSLSSSSCESMFENCPKLVNAKNLTISSVSDRSCFRMFANCTSLSRTPTINATNTGVSCYEGMFSGCTVLDELCSLNATVLSRSCYKYMFANCNLKRSLRLIATSLADSCYYGMFEGNKNLKDIYLIDGTTLAVACYEKMFHSCIGVETAPMLLLPATTLKNSCYKDMFKSCVALKEAPALPATKLARSCYQSMFEDCRKLETAPKLPATTLADSCYKNMFNSCIALTEAPALPATKLTESCYQSMFEGCKVLTNAPALPATALATNCYKEMFKNTALRSAPELSSTSLAESCYYGMFSDCSYLETIPTLPALDMAVDCYDSMFASCAKLKAIDSLSLPATKLNNSCYKNMFRNCKGLEVAPALPATYMQKSCYENMFANCSNLKTVPTISATSTSEQCFMFMFYKCTSLKTVPKLKPYILATKCYYGMMQGCSGLGPVFIDTLDKEAGEYSCAYMFANCSGLNVLKLEIRSSENKSSAYKGMFSDCKNLTTAELQLDVNLSNACSSLFKGCGNLSEISVNFKSWEKFADNTDWVSGVSKTGFFVCDSLLEEKRGPNNIPEGWTVKKTSDLTRKITFSPESVPYGTIITSGQNHYAGRPILFSVKDRSSENLSAYITIKAGSNNVEFQHVIDTIFSFKMPYGAADPYISISYRKVNHIEFESLADNSTVQLNCSKGVSSLSLWYSTNNGYFYNKYDASYVFTLNKGEKLYMYGENYTGLSSKTSNVTTQFAIKGKVKAHGDVMSLIDYNEDANKAEIPNAYCFAHLFEDCEGLYLVDEGFLPATTLTDHCYLNMFAGCTSLAVAPTLPATTLKEYCYVSMFEGCANLRFAPYLPARNLEFCCYGGMFKNCSSLANVTTNFADWGQYNFNTLNWLEGVAASGEFYNRGKFDETSFERGPSRVPVGWNLYGCHEVKFKGSNYIYILKTKPSNGSLTPMFVKGDTVRFTLAYSNAETLDALVSIATDNGSSVQCFAEDAVYTFVMPDNNVTVSVSLVATKCLTFKAMTDNTTIRFDRSIGATKPKIEYSLNNGVTWATFGGEVTLAANATVRFRGNNPTGFSHSLTDYTKFVMSSGSIKHIAGNVMSLIDGVGVAKEIPNKYCFLGLFANCSALNSVTKDLLPATTLKKGCYQGMFGNCTSLKVSPILPATQLVDYCYSNMYSGCENLKSINVAFTSWDTLCTQKWVENVPLFGTFYCPSELPVKEGTSYIPKGWSVKKKDLRVELSVDAVVNNYVLPFDKNVNKGDTVTFELAENTADAYVSVSCTTGKVDFDTLANGKFSFVMPNENVTIDVTNCLMFVAQSDNSKIHIFNYGSSAPDVKYSLDYGKTWSILGTKEVAVSAGQEVKVCGYNPKGFSTKGNYTSFIMTGQWKAYGSVMSLIDSVGLTKEIPNAYCFNGLFVPRGTGFGSVALLKSPLLPATILKANCYNSMFYNCKGLTEAPALPATTLADSCYYQMFSGCTYLTAAPALPATTLVKYCYYQMFSGCTGLTAAPALPATTLADNCYCVMFSGCTGLTAAPALPATTLQQSCYNSMFSGCTGLTEAPALPANTLVKYCYKNMFNGCTSLNSVRVSFTEWSNATTNATDNWLNNVAPTGTFVCAGSLESKVGASYIPEGWTITNTSYAVGLSIDAIVNDYVSTKFGFYKQGDVVEFELAENAANAYVSVYSKTGKINVDTLSNGKYSFVMPNEKVTIDVTNCLMFVAQEDNSQIRIVNNGSSAPKVKYSLDYGQTWSILGNDTVTVSAGQEVKVCGYNTTFSTSASNYTNFFMTGKWKAYGSVMSLIDSVGLTKEIPNDFCFVRLFNGCSGLIQAPALPATTLKTACYFYMFNGCSGLTAAPALPATTLANFCYQSMFYGCTGLTEAPALPATTLAPYCYNSMFSGCTGLTAAPALPATTLQQSCYNSMFSGCTGLTKAPALPATTLQSSCYYSMFYGCSGLTEAPALPATTLANGCYQSMFLSCTGLTNAPALPATTLQSSCYYNMFNGCTGLTAAPALPATTLANGCYKFMFNGCTGLTEAPALPATTLQKECYMGMFSGCKSLNSVRVSFTEWSDATSKATNIWLNTVASTGTFVCTGSLETKTGVSYIPEGWTIIKPFALTLGKETQDNGYVESVLKSEYLDGENVTFTVKPMLSGWNAKVFVADINGNSVEVSEDNGKFSFTMPSSAVTVDVKYYFNDDTECSDPFVFIGDADSISYTRAISSHWGTLCLPYAFSESNCTNIKLFSVKSISANGIELKQVSSVSAGEPVLYYATSASTLTVKVPVSSIRVDCPLSEDYIKGTFVKQTISSNADNYYYLKGDKFYQGKDNFVLMPFRACLFEEELAGNGIRSFSILPPTDEMLDDADEVITSKEIEAIFNMDGQRITKVKEGRPYIIRYNDGSVKKAISY